MMKRMLVPIILLIIFLAGCGVSDINEIKRAVRNYDKKLASALRKGDAAALSDYATEAQMGRVYIFISELLGKDRLLNAELISIDINEARKATTKEITEAYEQIRERYAKRDLYMVNYEVSDKVAYAMASTKETWKYTPIDRSTGKPLDGVQTITYQATYFLTLKKGKWLVDNLDAVEIPAEM